MRRRAPRSPVFTLVISHPTSRPGREEMIEQVKRVSRLYGGRVIQISDFDGLALIQNLRKRLPPEEVEAGHREIGTPTAPVEA